MQTPALLFAVFCILCSTLSIDSNSSILRSQIIGLKFFFDAVDVNQIWHPQSELIDGHYYDWGIAPEIGEWNFTQDADGEYSDNPCTSSWLGIQCNADNDAITGITLEYKGIHGTLPKSIIAFAPSLEVLDLCGNSLYGALPHELFRLTALKILNVKFNKFSGSLPDSISGMKSLTFLDLTSNRGLNGYLPSGLFEMTQLRSLSLALNTFKGEISGLSSLYLLTELYLDTNEFTGRFPTEFGRMGGLARLKLDNNGISGSLPPAIGNLTSMTGLSLSANRLTGTLPPELFRLSRLVLFSISNNSLVGSLPSNINQASSLTILSVCLNKLSGNLPSGLYNATRLKMLDLSNNFFDGSISEAIGNMMSLTTLNVEYNSLSSTLPTELGLLRRLKTISISKNRFTGKIPSELGSLPYLVYLRFSSNLLSGSIPTEFSTLTPSDFAMNNNLLSGKIQFMGPKWSSIRVLRLDHNLFTGTIPSSLMGQFTQLKILKLSRNDFHGPFPFGDYQNATQRNLFDSVLLLDCSYNRFTGTLPQQLPGNNWQSINVAHNSLSGSIPSGIFNLQYLVEITASDNMFTSTLPSNVGNALFLQYLDFARNSLVGTIPEGFGLITVKKPKHLFNDFHANGIQIIQFSSNKFTGQLPSQLCNLVESLEILDFSSNAMTGPIPSCFGELTNLNTISLANNRFVSGNQGLGFLLGPNLRMIDISSNAFDGELPSGVFLLKKLRIFAAVSNCFHGSLSETICEATELRVLVLDGLSAGASCRTSLWGKINPFGFTGDTGGRLSGSLPACIFSQLPNISTLHLSGNGLSGSLPQTLLGWPTALSDLALSHNRLTGKIPTILQKQVKQFSRFDLSHNKLDGLLTDLNVQSNHTIVSLAVNRFSGLLSASVIHALKVSVLEGSLFGCSDRSTQLPLNDPHIDHFKCGSNTFNSYMYAFSAFVVVIGIAAMFRYRYSFSELLSQFHPTISRESAASSKYDANILMLMVMLENFRVFVALMGTACILMLMPVYGALSSQASTHTDSYAWTVSGGFKTGANAAAVQLALWVVLLTAINFYLRNFKRAPTTKAGTLAGGDPQEEDDASSSRWYSSYNKYFAVAQHTAIFVLNVVVIMGMNIGYVLVVTRFDIYIQAFASLALTAFKLVWSTFVLRRILRKISKKSMVFELLLGAFNSVIAPALSLIIADSNCFSTALYAPHPVDSTYEGEWKVPDHSYELDFVDVLKTERQSYTQVFQPSFLYNYQCSATLLQTYSPVFLLMTLISAFGDPLLYYTARACSTRWPSTSSMVLRFVPRILLTSQERQKADDARKQAGKRSFYAAYGFRILNWQRFTLGMLQDLLLLLSFGIAAPLLGLGVLTSLLSRTLQLHYLIISFIKREQEEQQTESEKENSSRIVDLIADCSDFSHQPSPLIIARWFLVIFASIFLSFFVLDSAGDQLGWKVVLWAPLLMLTLPVSLSWLVEACMPSALFGKNDLTVETKLDDSVRDLQSAPRVTLKRDTTLPSYANPMHTHSESRISSLEMTELTAPAPRRLCAADTESVHTDTIPQQM